LAAFEEEKKQFEANMKKLEKEMRTVFDQKVQEKEEKLKNDENQVPIQYFEVM